MRETGANIFLEMMKGQSTSPPSGNLVDGLPLVAVRLQLAASWNPEKFRPIYNFGCFSVQVDKFVHCEKLSFVFLPPSSVKKKTRELFSYSFAR